MRMVSFNKTKRLSRKEQPFLYFLLVDASTSDATTSLKPIAIFNL